MHTSHTNNRIRSAKKTANNQTQKAQKTQGKNFFHNPANSKARPAPLWRPPPGDPSRPLHRALTISPPARNPLPRRYGLRRVDLLFGFFFCFCAKFPLRRLLRWHPRWCPATQVLPADGCLGSPLVGSVAVCGPGGAWVALADAFDPILLFLHRVVVRLRARLGCLPWPPSGRQSSLVRRRRSAYGLSCPSGPARCRLLIPPVTHHPFLEGFFRVWFGCFPDLTAAFRSAFPRTFGPPDPAWPLSFDSQEHYRPSTRILPLTLCEEAPRSDSCATFT